MVYKIIHVYSFRNLQSALLCLFENGYILYGFPGQWGKNHGGFLVSCMLCSYYIASIYLLHNDIFSSLPSGQSA